MIGAHQHSSASKQYCFLKLSTAEFTEQPEYEMFLAER
jgi:hypothetical protein